MARRSSNAIAEERQERRENELKADGWFTARVSMKRQWSSGKDLYGLFDIMGFKVGKVILSQVTSHGDKGYKELIKDWMWENRRNLPVDLICEVAIWKPAGKKLPERFVVYRYTYDIDYNSGMYKGVKC